MDCFFWRIARTFSRKRNSLRLTNRTPYKHLAKTHQSENRTRQACRQKSGNFRSASMTVGLGGLPASRPDLCPVKAIEMEIPTLKNTAWAWHGNPPPHPFAGMESPVNVLTSFQIGHCGSNPSLIRRDKIFPQNSSRSTWRAVTLVFGLTINWLSWEPSPQGTSTSLGIG